MKFFLHGRKSCVSIHVLRRGRCVTFRQALDTLAKVSIHVLRRGRCVDLTDFSFIPGLLVSIHVLRRGRCVIPPAARPVNPISSFNPRPPKRTLCLFDFRWIGKCNEVSIHVLRRGRCVGIQFSDGMRS